MRSVFFGAAMAMLLGAASLASKPAQAMALPAPAGLKAAVEQTNLTETVNCWDWGCGRRYYRPNYRPYSYGYRPYYRPYSYGYRPYSYGYRPYYRPYSYGYGYRPYSYGHRPYYRPYSYGYSTYSPAYSYRPVGRYIYGPAGPGYYDPRNVW